MKKKFEFIPAIYFLGMSVSVLFFWPFIEAMYEVPKVYFFLIWNSLATLIILFFHPKSFINFRLQRTVLKWMFVYLIWVIICSFLGANLLKSLTGNVFRVDGIITLMSLMWWSIMTGLFWSDSWKDISVRVLSIIGLILSLVWLCQSLGVSRQIFFAKPMGNTIYLSGFLALILPVFFYYWRTGNKLAAGSIITAVQLSLVYIGLKGGWLLSILAWTGQFFLIMRDRERLLVIVVLIVSIIFVGRDVYSEERAAQNTEGRLRIWTDVYQGAMTRPFLGYGYANTDHVFNLLKPEGEEKLYVDQAHSIWLEIFSSSGLVGLSIFISMTLLIIYRVRIIEDKKWREMLLMVLLLYFAKSTFNITSISEDMLFWWVTGLSLRIQ